MKKRYYIIPSLICLVFGISLLTLYLNIKANLHENAVEDVMMIHQGVKVLDRGKIKFSGIEYEGYDSIFLMFEINDLGIFCEDGMCKTFSDMQMGANLISLTFHNWEPLYEELTIEEEPLLWQDPEISCSLKKEVTGSLE